MTDADRKTLTEYLGECWHEIDETGNVYFCKHCRQTRVGILIGSGRCTDNRSFTTPADIYAVYSKMVERGEWDSFRLRAIFVYDGESSFEAWLFCLAAPDQIPERMAMAAEWVRTHDRP